jgi:hypothetical protein
MCSVSVASTIQGSAATPASGATQSRRGWRSMTSATMARFSATRALARGDVRLGVALELQRDVRAEDVCS